MRYLEAELELIPLHKCFSNDREKPEHTFQHTWLPNTRAGLQDRPNKCRISKVDPNIGKENRTAFPILSGFHAHPENIRLLKNLHVYMPT